MKNPIRRRLKHHYTDPGTGIYSVCSANRFVLESAMLQAIQDNSLLLIESTSNQVDQFGGYSGMTPLDFVSFVREIADHVHMPWSRILLGGDHLGPNVWQNEPVEPAMGKAVDQIKAYVKAGYSKIHLDTSMHLQGDPLTSTGIIMPELVAERAADLCAVAENSYATRSRVAIEPVYVIGTDVPIPGGARHDLSEIEITSIERVRQTIDLTRSAFFRRGLQDAWNRVIAVVVQPGVEFSDAAVIDYDHRKAIKVSNFISKTQSLVYEAHSTDYQLPATLIQMVKDHFAILKVGPWLTFAFREAVFSFADMELEYLKSKKSMILSHIKSVLEQTMLNNPIFWQKHYRGDSAEQALARAFSYSDRVRYYWPDPQVKESLNRLLYNMMLNPPSLNLVSQYFPEQYWKIRGKILKNEPVPIIHDFIRGVITYYAAATGMQREKRRRLT